MHCSLPRLHCSYGHPPIYTNQSYKGLHDASWLEAMTVLQPPYCDCEAVYLMLAPGPDPMAPNPSLAYRACQTVLARYYLTWPETRALGGGYFTQFPPFLTHWGRDKMAAILADDIFNCIFVIENDRILIQISLNHVPRSPIDNKSVLVRVMAWRRPGDKPLPGPMMTQFTDAYMRHSASMS